MVFSLIDDVEPLLPQLDPNPKQQSVDSDTITVEFKLSNGTSIPVDNFTSYWFDSDFLTPADAFRLEVSDEQVNQLYKYIQVGAGVSVKINNQIPILYGYVDKVDLRYDRSGGKSMHISGRDLLGVMADSTVRPDLNANAGTKISDIIKGLFRDFQSTTGQGIFDFDVNDSAQLTAATGGKVGIQVKGKTLKGRNASFNKAIERQIKPHKEEGYMQYATSLCKELGLNIKMSPGSNLILVQPPAYDRAPSEVNFTLNHFGGGSFSTSFIGDPSTNNVISGSMNLDWSKQPSAIFVELNQAADPSFSRSSYKVVLINDITGFISDNHGDSNSINFKGLAPSVVNSIKSYCNTNSAGVPINGSATIMTPNIYLSQSIPILLRSFFQPNLNNISRPMFLYDGKAATIAEAQFFAQRRMSELQNQFFTLEYEVMGHSQNGYVWQPNLMCNVNDTTFGINQSINGSFWIQRRTFIKSRSGGTRTHLTLKLPYIFPFVVTQ